MAEIQSVGYKYKLNEVYLHGYEKSFSYFMKKFLFYSNFSVDIGFEVPNRFVVGYAVVRILFCNFLVYIDFKQLMTMYLQKLQ